MVSVPIRGTNRLCNLLFFRHFTKSVFCYTPDLVTFGHLFRLLFEYTEDYFNQLRVIAFDSYQEYTIATDTAISARGTEKAGRWPAFLLMRGSVPGNAALAGQTGKKRPSVPGNAALAGQTGLLAGRFAAANQKDGESCDGQQ